MAAKRGKTQARRSGGGSGNSGLPGWAWLVIGVAITLLVVMAAPRMMNRDRVGFFRPTPNPDAQPEPVSEEAVVDDDVETPASASKKPASDDGKKQDFDFYTLLPGKEVPMTDAELAASEEAEKTRQQQAAAKPEASATPATATATDEDRPLPAPVADGASPPVASADPRPTASAPSTPAPAPASASASAPTVAKVADSRYILQAGAFQASGQAEELKARIALLGLGARVESAKIGGKTVYRVRMGPYGTASELAEAKRKLAGGGLPAMAVKTN